MTTLTKLPINIATGIALIVAGSLGSSLSATAAIVTNGDFETGDFTGFTRSGNENDTSVATSCAGIGTNSGTYCADLGPFGSRGYLSQDLTTAPGTTYNLTFFLASDGGSLNEFEAIANGVQVFYQANIPSQPYTQYSLNFTATSASTPLAFGFRNDTGSLGLDDIAVNSVPEPSSELGTFAFGALATVWMLFHQKVKKGVVSPK